MTSELDRAEHEVESHSVALKKPLGLRDLVLTQILFVVGSSWVGTAAKLGPSHLFFWLLAILLFYIPQAAVVIYLNRLMPLEGGLYQWAKLGFNEFVGFIVAWNLWLLSITVIALGGMFVTTNLSYALGEAAAWMPESKWCVSLISCALVAGLGWTGIRGLSLGKWVHNIGAFAMLLVYGALIALPFISLARGELKQYQPLQIVAPTISIFYCFNIFSKLAVGALSGFEYVAILAGETRAPARDIGRSVIIASPVIAVMFILGTSSVLAFIGNNQIDLIGPVPQTLRLGLRSFPIAGAIASVGILLMTVRSISSTSVHLTGSSRLPMVAGWDQLLPGWFSRLHPRYKTPINSIIFVGALTLAIARLSRPLRHSDRRRGRDSFGCANLAARGRVLRLCRFLARSLLHRLSDHRRAESANFRGKDYWRERYRECGRRDDLCARQGTTRRCQVAQFCATQLKYSGKPLSILQEIISGTSYGWSERNVLSNLA